MSNTNFYECMIDIVGSETDIATFAGTHLAGNRFSFNSIVAMPPELDFEMSNWVDDGYATLFGDWTTMCSRWMFKEAAAEFGFPFPLESREQVLRCVRALGEFGEARLSLGRRFKSNLDRFGFGHATDWRKKNWGSDTDAFDLIASVQPTRIVVSFGTHGRPPDLMLAAYSKSSPGLEMTVSLINEFGKRSARFRLKGGKKSPLPGSNDDDVSASITTFRCHAGLGWLAHLTGRARAPHLVVMSERGHYMLEGTHTSLTFALHRIRGGETPQALAQRFSELSPGHVELLTELSADPTLLS